MIRKLGRIWLIGLFLTLLSIEACSPATTLQPTKSPIAASDTPTLAPTQTLTPEPSETEYSTPTRTLTATPDLRPKPEDWQSWPIIPDLSPAMIEVYQQGQELGRDPRVFSVLGDCQSSPTYFLSKYDEGRYTLEEGQEHLQETIDWYAGSFSHRSLTVKNGMTAPGALNPRWADPEQCESTETPVACEIRLSNPSLMLISLGTNWHPSTSHEQYVEYLSEIVEIILDAGLIPVLSTKADNGEGDYNRNLAMAEVAYAYEVPLWNFWAAVKELPNLGLDKDRENVYLNYKGWDIRNQSALALLDQIRRQLQQVED
jgi:hypothetical protein